MGYEIVDGGKEGELLVPVSVTMVGRSGFRVVGVFVMFVVIVEVFGIAKSLAGW